MKVSSTDVESALSGLSLNKSVGLDGFNPRILKAAAPIIATNLVSIFNMSLSLGIVPSDWKQGKVVPIHKGGSKTDCQNYQPIIMKVLERFVHNQLYTYLSDSGILSPHQSGFRPLHSTKNTIIHVTDYILANMDMGKLTGAVFMDLRKAFDTTPSHPPHETSAYWT